MRVEDIPRAKVLLGISPLLIYMRRARMSGSENFPPSSDEAAFSEAEWQKCYQEKRAGLEVLFGPMHERDEDSDISGLQFFPQSRAGTAISSMDLILPDGTGPVPSEALGTYELVAFTRHRPPEDGNARSRFWGSLDRIADAMMSAAMVACDEVLEPGDLAEIPLEDSEQTVSFLLEACDASITGRELPFMIGKERHGLMLLVEVFPSELVFADENGNAALIEKLREAGHYPFSDLERSPVV